MRPLNQRTVVSIVYVTAMFMAAMDASVVNLALPAIMKEFQAPPPDAGIVNIGYLVSLAVCLPIAGWLGDRWGTKRIFSIALGMFTTASLLCGLAEHLAALNLFRIIQGAGGGLITPVGMAILFRTFPPEERPKISRVLVLPVAVAPALGPIISGFFTDQLSWRWIFFINVPIGLIILLFGLLCLDEHMESDAGTFDLPGFLLSAPGMALAVFALSRGPADGFGSPAVLAAGIGGLVLLTALVLVELRARHPLLNLRLLADRVFGMMSIVSLFSAAGLLGMLYVFPLMYQEVLNHSALDTALITFPEALGLMLASQLMPRSLSKLGPRRLISAALLCASVLFGLLSLTGPGTNTWFLRMLLFLAGFFLGHAVGAVQVTSFANISSASMGRATTLFNVQNRLGSALGVAIMSCLLAVMSRHTEGELPDLAAYRTALLGASALLIAAFCFALGIRDADAAPGMGARSSSAARDERTAGNSK
ncbi:MULTISPECIES: MDR family MFS transporter [Bacillus]|uniref:DHA2 family efflux MFS transporter permease subunit n=1 Tax=Bacillus glycinifermentans TaxID=1664069 RepID=A0AAJ4D491_9BACI|nr:MULTISPECIES: MDR family MFS transporter [Bacillus]KKB74295.1 DSBA oxidoreductase [Bacillus sp. TH008]MDU0071903.1 MDR family MFS transporter [Bacillus sp. IG6]MED8019528.1 MDR family MFS transporter [Bacillus glycinifermentans]QAT67333.1 DHA2 family efflux MFS transporter permease subunit [Bacillus glycinifermentans]WKB76977.1 MDR family MFS transporter [Bacillus glycinifermentans]